MIITIHAAQRFLERVIKKPNFNQSDLEMALNYLNRVFKNVVPSSAGKTFVLPGFENDFFVVHKQNTIITIIPKNSITQG